MQTHQGINTQAVDEADVFAIHQEGGQTCIQVFFFRTGQNWGNRAYFPKADPALEPGEVLSSFLAQFYDDKPMPARILLSRAMDEQELLAEALCTKAGRKISISVPQRGEKKDLTDNALQNAREALGRRLAETSTQGRLFSGFAETFGLTRVPRRIEVYDNSHIMGTNAVGAMVVAGPEGFVKNQYRKFNIRSTEITPGDDFGMMREVMQRRFSRLIREHEKPDEAATEPVPDDEDASQAGCAGLAGRHPDRWRPGPDVGGARHPRRTRHFERCDGDRRRQGRRSRGRARAILRAGPRIVLAAGARPVLYFVQRLRDEAHRFAIGSHRARRKKEMIRNPLDEISGIGPSRKRALLLHFGTAKAVGRAAMEDLLAVEGISESTARLIYNHFHEQ